MEINKTQGSVTFEAKASETQKYNIVATAHYDGDDEITSISGGIVRYENKQVAGFSRHDGDANFNINFMGVEAIEQQDILAAVNEFIVEVEAKVKSNL